MIIKDVFLTMILVSTNSLVFTRNAEAQTGCSVQDQQTIQTYTQQVMQAAYTGNLQYAIQLGQQLQSQLSPSCLAALSQLQQQQPYGGYGGGYGGGGYGGYSPGVPSIYDHGGGTYSVPGGVTCGPSGCY
jgi:hypothetical protein